MAQNGRTSPRELKILHVLDHSLPLHSGYTFRSQNLLKAQQRRGWNPFALTSHKHELESSPQGVETIDGIRFFRTPGPRPEGSGPGAQMAVVRNLARRARQIVAGEHPDIIHAHSPVLNVLPFLAPWRPRTVPVVYEIRAFWEDAAVDHGSYDERSWKYRVVRALESWACRHVDRIVVICEGLKQDLIARGISENKIAVVQNAIDPDQFVSNPGKDKRQEWNLAGCQVIGFIGSFYRYEGLDILVKGFAELARRRSDVRLLLVGGGEVEAELHELVKAEGIADKVLFPGRVSHAEIPAVYATVDLLVYPRRSMRLTELVTPLKPLEAMAMEKSILASDIGGHRELIRDGETGFLVPPDDPHALAEAIEGILANPERANAVARAGRIWVREHRTWDVTTAPYAGIYAELRPE